MYAINTSMQLSLQCYRDRKVVVTAWASMQIYLFFVLYSIFVSIRDRFSHFSYWAFDRLGDRLLSKNNGLCI